MRQSRRFAGATTMAVMAVMLTTAVAWACVAGPSVFTSTVNIKAGEQMGVQGVDFSEEAPVLVRFDALDGPVLADLGLPDEDRGMVSGNVTIPADTSPGDYVLVFTQYGADGDPIQTPVRALVSVVGEAGAAPVVGPELGAADSARVAELATEDNSISTSTLVLMAVGVAAVGMLLAGTAALFASRRESGREAATVDA